MRRISAALIVAIGGACASAQTPPRAPRAPTETAAASTPLSAAVPMPTTLLPGVGMSTAPPQPGDDDDHDATLGSSVCAKDEDCWSRTCCPARAPEECVHASRARKCAIMDITCKPSPMHYTCVCDSGTCKGRLAPP